MNGAAAKEIENEKRDFSLVFLELVGNFRNL